MRRLPFECNGRRLQHRLVQSLHIAAQLSCDAIALTITVVSSTTTSQGAGESTVATVATIPA